MGSRQKWIEAEPSWSSDGSVESTSQRTGRHRCPAVPPVPKCVDDSVLLPTAHILPLSFVVFWESRQGDR
jgi:hypothetical protein